MSDLKLNLLIVEGLVVFLSEGDEVIVYELGQRQRLLWVVP